MILRPPVLALHRAEVARLYLAPQAAADLAVTQLAYRAGPSRPVALAAGLLVWADDVVLAGLNRLGREKAVDLVTPVVFIGPLPDGFEHVLLDLNSLVADGRVMEGAEHVIDDLIDRDAGVFPGIEDAAGHY